MNLLALLRLAWKYRKWLAYVLLAVALVVAILTYRHHLIALGEERGAARVQVQWDANKAAIQTVADKAVADAKAKEDAAAANNAEVLRNANTELVAIAADRDSLVGRLRSARQATAGRCSLPEAGSVSGPIGTPENSGDGSLDVAVADAITEAKSNNVTHAALIRQISPQLLPH